MEKDQLAAAPLKDVLRNFIASWITIFSWESFKKLSKGESSNQNDFLETSHGYFNLFAFRYRIENCFLPFALDANDRIEGLGKSAILVITPWVKNDLDLPFNIHEKFIYELIQIMIDMLKYRPNLSISDVIFNRFNEVEEDKFEEILESLDKELKKVAGRSFHFSTTLNPTDWNMMEEYVEDLDKKVLFYSVPSENYMRPGNGYSKGELNTSLAASAAACSTFAEVQNPKINSKLTTRYKSFSLFP